jgi:hypothetical protein
MSRKLALEKLEYLYEIADPQDILNYLIGDYLSGSQALEALESAEQEFNSGCDTCSDDECDYDLFDIDE